MDAQGGRGQHVPVPETPQDAPTAPPLRRWRRRVALAALVALGAVGGLQLVLLVAAVATSEPVDPAYAGPVPLPPDVAARFAYPEADAPADVYAELAPGSGPGWTSRTVQVRVTSPGDAAPHLAQVIHVRPTGLQGRAPAVVISPILGGDYGLERTMATALAARGLHSAIVMRAESLLADGADEARLERVLRTGVIDRRRAIDWLQAQPDIDPARLGALGASTGGIGTVLLHAVEPRVRASVVLLAGGDLGDVLAASSEPRVVRWREGRLAQVPGVGALAGRVRAAVASDPLLLARHVDARRVLFGLSRFDGAVPYAAQLRLHEALGRPACFTLPLGHQSSALALPWVMARTSGFLADELSR